MLESGLIHQSNSGEYSITDSYDASGGAPSMTSTETGVETTANTGAVGEETVNSHLDTWFTARGYTREDVLVISGAIQIVFWCALLYLEVSDR